MQFKSRLGVTAGIAAMTLACGMATAADRVDWQGARPPTATLADLQPIDRVPVLRTPDVDFGALLAEDDIRARNGMAPRYAVPQPVLVTPATHGVWERVDDESAVWRLRVQCPEALSVNLGFTRYSMPEGARLVVYTRDGHTVLRPFTAKDNETHAELWLPPLPGDEVVIEVTVLDKVREQLALDLTHVGHGYRGFYEMVAERSGACNVDVVCPEGDDWQNEIQSVGVISTGGSTFCTGFMVNNTSNDLTPYFMTANHCGVGAGNAPSLVVFWNYQNSFCRPPGSPQSGQPGDGVLDTFQTGSIFRAAYGASDFTLVELDDDPDPAWEIGFAGWDRRDMSYNDGAVAIHHPQTDEKRISFEGDPVVPDSYLGENPPGDSTHLWVSSWDLGTTEPGSSGSPLFSYEKRVIGQLHGGYASCTDLRGDWYGRFHLSWTGGGSPSTRLSDWLDAAGTGAEYVDTISGAGMVVAPGGDVLHVGVVGGPFTNDPVVYTLTNYAPTDVQYSVTLDAAGTAPLLLDAGAGPVTGTIAAGGGTASVTLSVAPSATGLPAGLYSTAVSFEDITNSRTQVVTHDLEIGLTNYDVTPENALVTGGPVGGPFNTTQTYTITNTRPTPVDVEVAASEPWIYIDGVNAPLVRSLGAFASADVTVGFGAETDDLPAGLYEGEVAFTNLSGDAGDTTRPVSVDVGRYTFAATDVPQPISDNNTITSTISVAESFCIADVNVEMDISHTYIGDLIIDLTSPEGTTVRLHDRTGGTTEDIVVTYDDEGFTPDGPGTLADFDGEIATGTWTLTVSDNAGADTGTLNAWALKVASNAGGACAPVAEDVFANIDANAPSPITLDGASINGAFDYIIESLPDPALGTLSDPNSGPITFVPYTLAIGGDTVIFDPADAVVGPASFTYSVFDGLHSEIATVDVLIGIETNVYEFTMDTNPGWSTTGDWAFGQPTGGGSGAGDPTSGFTGNNVYGYNLNGDYTNNMPERYLTTNALDLTGVVKAKLEFRRWLGVESSTWDQAALQISTDASSWTNLWQHSGSTLNESSWSLQTYDISAIADDQPAVYFRWVLGPTDGSVVYQGWNIDDVVVTGILPPDTSCPADLDGDGNVDFDDLGVLLGAFGQNADGDIDDDGDTDFDDLGVLLGAFGQPC